MSLLNPKGSNVGGWNTPTATLNACRVVCHEARGIKPSCNFHFGCLKPVDNLNFGGCLWKFLKNLRYEKKNLNETENFFFWKINLLQIFSKQIVFFMSNLHLECFQLSFDIHVVHVSQKLWIFKNRCTESEQISAVKVGYFGATLRQNYAT